MSPIDPVVVIGLSGGPARRIASLIRLASRRDLVFMPTPELLVSSGQPAAVICSGADACDVVDICESHFPLVPIVVWKSETRLDLVELASAKPQIRSLIGWPESAELPRVWELAYALQRILNVTSAPIAVTAPLHWDGIGKRWNPQTTEEMFTTITGVEQLLEQVNVDRRTSRRALGVAHEMLVNAMYDAPKRNGKARFAQDRTQRVSLAPEDAPILTVGLDGVSISVQVIDPFGGLRRDHLFSSLIRGMRSREASDSDVIDTSGGGAGLGLHRIVSEASATIFDVVEGRATRVTSTLELGQPNRERHRQPKSVHFFHRVENPPVAT